MVRPVSKWQRSRRRGTFPRSCILPSVAFWAAMALFLLPSRLGAQTPPPPPVEVSKVREERIQTELTIMGNVRPQRRATVAAETEGTVVALPVREGDHVGKGSVLARLSRETLELQLARAEAATSEQEGEVERARLELERAKSLLAKKVLSAQAHEDRRIDLYVAEQRLARLKAEEALIRDTLRKTEILAPFEGIVTQRLAEVGEWIPKGGGIAVVADLSHPEVVVDLPEDQIAGIDRNTKVTVAIPALGPRTFPGRILAVVPEGDPNARTFPVRIEIDDPGMRIKGGMSAAVSFTIGPPTPVRVVPKDAIVTQGEVSRVFLVKGDRVEAVPVKVGRAFRDVVEVEGNLSPGDTVIVRGNERLRPGQQVRVVDL